MNRATDGPQTMPGLGGKEKNRWKVLPFGIWHRIVRQKFADISDKQTAPIFTVEDWAKKVAKRKQAASKADRVSKTALPTACFLFAWLALPVWRWRQYDPPKRRWSSTGLHGAASRKIIFKVDVVRSSHPTHKISDLSGSEPVSAVRNQSLYRRAKLNSNNSTLWVVGESL
jgi:hypothetical protein